MSCCGSRSSRFICSIPFTCLLILRPGLSYPRVCAAFLIYFPLRLQAIFNQGSVKLLHVSCVCGESKLLVSLSQLIPTPSIRQVGRRAKLQ